VAHAVLEVGAVASFLDRLPATRAREELDWTPRVSAADAFAEVVEGLRKRAGIETPPLDPAAGGPARSEEILSGVGEREG
jgi:UDP-glucose 4-epimerase